LVVPTFNLDADFSVAVVAILGTTISPYLFFWQAGEEMEELRRRKRKPLIKTPEAAPRELKRIRMDTLVGMALSNLIALLIMFATAATLHAKGVTKIESSAQAAEALRPVARDFAFFLFAAGVIGTGMLAVPVLAGSAAYAVSEMFRWREGLDQRPKSAKAFYGVIVAATLGGIALTFAPLDPMRALYWSAVINGLLAAPLIALMVAIGMNRRIMGGRADDAVVDGARGSYYRCGHGISGSRLLRGSVTRRRLSSSSYESFDRGALDAYSQPPTSYLDGGLPSRGWAGNGISASLRNLGFPSYRG
jgi:Mn2+/Fe2+ NRAMP family transporter